jgi:hypothetical protein
MSDKANLTALVLGTLGVLFFMAMAFNVLPKNMAIFAGIACFIIAGAVKRMAAQKS